MSDQDSASDVISRAESAIRRARGLTRAYSDILEPPCSFEAAPAAEPDGVPVPPSPGMSHLPLHYHASPSALLQDAATDAGQQDNDPGQRSGSFSRASELGRRPYLRYFQASPYLPPREDPELESSLYGSMVPPRARNLPSYQDAAAHTGGSYPQPQEDTLQESGRRERTEGRDAYSYYLEIFRQRAGGVPDSHQPLQSRSLAPAPRPREGGYASTSRVSFTRLEEEPWSPVATRIEELQDTEPFAEDHAEAEAGSTADLIARCPATEPVLVVAQRLASLQRQQSETMRQLLRLRLEQLRLRQQQLSALQCLLRTEAACIEGNPLQLSAVQQAVDLLADSLEDVHSVASTLQWDGEVSQVAAVAQNVSEADARAEEVSMMARQLLAALRTHPMRTQDSQPEEQVLRGATGEEIAAHPMVVCTAESGVLGEPCSICLGSFKAGDSLRAVQCNPPNYAHHFHRACIDEWLA
eukprot:CAMPEP_0117660640 /NCGR_PEP_ID=MMETSP0804-20121206/7074_1 /TAXON_ID=1074897 /ORGANISM="Tetraselmis astigmatica, Strain CCMP880" /LENGTH=468 /DNA_ID=CAMNT_0005467379 /DNA_START=160 /DNA_END=1562 /DNA_ORIENTATION=+